MAKMIMIVDIPNVEAPLADAHEVAEEILDTYEEQRSHVVETFEATFVSAEWVS